MNKISHLLVTGALLSKYTEFGRMRRMLVLTGSILPDILLHTYVKGHTWSERSDEIFQVIRARQGMEKQNPAFFLRYGCALHYIEDFFTWAHNLNFDGTLKEHTLYELQLYRELVGHKDEVLSNDNGVEMDAEQLISQLEALHEEYMKKTPDVKNDRYYITKAAGMAADYFFAAWRSSGLGKAA